MIIVTGGSGRLGRAVVARLLDRVPAERVGVSVRDPERLRDLAERGVRVRRGDFADPDSLTDAFDGASRVLVVSTDRTGEPAVAAHRAAIAAAEKAGAERVVYTSHAGASPTSPFPPMPDHAATEDALASCGLPFIALRNGFYASTVPRLLGTALETGELAAPEDGPVAWTAHADLAEAAAVALTEDELDGTTPALTAAEAIDLEGVAATAAQLTGRPVRRVVVPDQAYRAGLVSHGVPGPAADMLVGLFRAARRGDFARTDPTLARLVGRPLQTVHDVLVETVPARR